MYGFSLVSRVSLGPPSSCAVMSQWKKVCNEKRVSRNKEIDELLLTNLENGQTLTSICSTENMPSLRAVRKWKREDIEFEDAAHSSWIRVLSIRFDVNADVQQKLIGHPDQFDPKVINASATIMRDRSHQIIAAQSKLDKRYNDRSKVEHLYKAVIALIVMTIFDSDDPRPNWA